MSVVLWFFFLVLLVPRLMLDLAVKLPCSSGGNLVWSRCVSFYGMPLLWPTSDVLLYQLLCSTFWSCLCQVWGSISLSLFFPVQFGFLFSEFLLIGRELHFCFQFAALWNFTVWRFFALTVELSPVGALLKLAHDASFQCVPEGDLGSPVLKAVRNLMDPSHILPHIAACFCS